jgi:class 3 adenylate cyclase/tetratricopeptide (TPR) repeat protein
MECPECQFVNPEDFQFCGNCGHRFGEPSELERTLAEAEGERKHVTVLFSDLSGYTAMCERLDPEEVKEIMSRIFGDIAQVVTKYEGFIEKFVGDAVMALFGVPKAHEDDPVRAIRAAGEINDLVEALSPQLEDKVGKPLSMHSGINTGLVVTGEVDLEKGTHGVAGDTINLAARLCSFANPGEIVVGLDTYRQAEGHFVFEALEPTKVKGKAEPVQVYKVLSPKERPVTVRRLSGLRADLIGRKAEIVQLTEALDNLRQGKGRIFSICGEAGTGKSRLTEEFKARLDIEDIQWLKGHAYAYCQNIPYFPLIDLISRAFHIEEADSPEKVKAKVESAIEDLIGKEQDVVPYIGSLYALRYPEIEDMSPEHWKSKLQDSVMAVLSALARRAPTIFFLEDLHWADPSSVELLRNALLQVRQPAIVLCVHRPEFNLLTSHQLNTIGETYQEIRLKDLSASEAQDMLESLLKTESIPADLRRFVQDKAEGNPFYLEELVNSLIESGTLIRSNGAWKVVKSISESDISSTIHGLIASRLDRLENEAKRILQEASVIGRAFLYEILKRITEFKEQIDERLRSLEQLDLIRTRSLQPELEYIFKHALTQDIVYNGLLKKERKQIHEITGLVMEQLFQERLPEFYETLAFHFKNSLSIDKAVHYLMKSGEKSLKRYAIEEAHQYHQEAFDILANKPDKSKEENNLLIDLLIKWGFVFYYRGDNKGLLDLLMAHEGLARSLDDKAGLGMFYAWLGYSLCIRAELNESYEYLCKALEIGEDISNETVTAYACAWLSWTCAALGLFDDAIAYGKRAQKISRVLEGDHFLHFKSLGGLAHAHCYKGDIRNAFQAGKALLEYGQKYSDNRSMFMGHIETGLSHYISGDFQSAIECAQKAITISVDPFHYVGGKLVLAMSYGLDGQFQEAEDAAHEILNFSEIFGCEIWETPARMTLGGIFIAKGHISEGVKMIEDARELFRKAGHRYFLARSEQVLGKVFLKMIEGTKETKFSTLIKNLGFLVKNVPFAGKKAENHFNKAIQIAKEIGAASILGEAKLGLGMLHKAKGRIEEARDYIAKSIQIFEQTGAETNLQQAKQILATLPGEQ